MASQQEQPLSSFTLISRPRWLWLVCAVLAVAALLTYGFLGAIPRTVRGIGITRDGLELLSVAAPQAGIIERFLVKDGQQLEPNDPIATLTAPVLKVEIEAARQRVSLLNSEDRRLTTGEATALAESMQRRDASIREAEASIKSSTSLFTARTRLLEEQEKLLKQGMVAKETVLGTQTTVAELESSIDTAWTSIANSKLETTQASTRAAQGVASRRESILEATATLQRLEKQQSDGYTIRAITAGTVVEISATVGDAIETGQELVIMKPVGSDDQELQIIAFLPQGKAKELKAGDIVQVNPTFADRSRYGFMKGRLSRIDIYAATTGELKFFLQSSGMVRDLEDRYKTILVAVIALEKDPSTESGFVWSTRDGWPGTIGPGTLLNIQVVFKVDRPIDLLLPWIRSLIGQ